MGTDGSLRSLRSEGDTSSRATSALLCAVAVRADPLVLMERTTPAAIRCAVLISLLAGD
jgi:hypothetical protein